MKKIISIIICLVLALFMTINAAAATIDMLVAGVGMDEGRTVNVTIIYGSVEDAQKSTLLVIKEGESIVTAEDSAFRHIAQKSVTGNVVKYDFNMAVNDRVGTYDLYVGGSKIDAPDSTKITFDMTNATTIKFVSDGVEILPSVLVNANIGEALDLTGYGANTVEYEGVMYKRDGTNSATYTPSSATSEVTITYTLDDVTTIEKVSATVIDGNLPVLPMSLDAITAEGVNTAVTISSWDFSSLVPGENIVYGVCNETSKLAEATVTVLPMSFEVADTTSTGVSSCTVYLQEAMYAYFRIEFDMVINKISDTGANFGYDGASWGSGAFNITPNGGNLKVVGGNKTGTSDGGSTIKSGVKAGETYRILVEANPVTDTFSVYATAMDGTKYSVLDKTFRKTQSPDAINSINLRGNNGATAGDLAIKNVKVCSAPLVDVNFVNESEEIVKAIQCNANESMAYTISAGETYFASSDGTAAIYAIPETTVTGSTTVTVYPVENKYAVLEDAYVEGGQVKGIDKAYPTYHVFVASAGGTDRAPLEDADGVAIATKTPSTLGSSRVGFFQFPVVDAKDGELVYANFYVTSWHGNTFSNGNKAIRLAGYAVNDTSWIEAGELGSYTSSAAPLLEGFGEPIFTPSYAYVADYVTLDITEPMKKAKELNLTTLTIRLNAGWGAAYVAERESCMAGEEFEGLASYVSVVDGGKDITITGATKVTKNGSIVTDAAEVFTVAATDSVKIYSDVEGTVAFTDGVKVYGLSNGVTDALDLPEGEYAAATAGVEMVDGAQVRVGGGVDETGKIGEGSGLRFITTIDYTDSLANVPGAQYGVKITAEGSSAEAVDIPATKWQKEGEVFTSAITNLAVSNFNRNFTATAYITVDGQTFLGDSATRSVYQVARGLLAKGYDGSYGESNDPNGDYEKLSEELLAVLNAYVNQTGIRLGFSTEGLGEYNGENGAYSGEGAFFEVSDAKVDGTTYSIKLTPVGQAVINTKIATEYVRINNNNSAIKTLVSVTDNNDGTYTLTFDAATLIK